jgi:hypothetical protein
MGGVRRKGRRPATRKVGLSGLWSLLVSRVWLNNRTSLPFSRLLLGRPRRRRRAPTRAPHLASLVAMHTLLPPVCLSRLGLSLCRWGQGTSCSCSCCAQPGPCSLCSGVWGRRDSNGEEGLLNCAGQVAPGPQLCFRTWLIVIVRFIPLPNFLFSFLCALCCCSAWIEF